MALNNSVQEASPKAFIHLLLVGGLVSMAYAIVTQQLFVAAIITSSPIILTIIYYGLSNPRVGYLLYIIYAYYYMYVMRYFQKSGFSVGLDILLIYLSIAILIQVIQKKQNIKITNAINTMTLCYMVWAIFIFFQMLNPGTSHSGIIWGLRYWIIGNLLLYSIASILSDTPKMLKTFLILLGILTFTAFLKLMYQRFVGFDLGERIWLNKGGASTHIIHSGIRYFSFFSDAGNFGPHMGAITLIYGIVTFNTHGRWLKIFYLTIFIVSMIGLFMSGTRSAIVVPFAGLVLYSFICKSLKITATSMILGITIFSVLAFTDIGQNNSFIRRMRTAIHPTEDASFNARVRNRRMIAEYLNTRPFGVGIDSDIPMLWLQNDGTYIEGTLPPDAYFVDIWIKHGIVGILLYLSIYAVIFLRCCYLIMFRIQDSTLRQILAAFTCAAFGLTINGYAGEAIGLSPTNFLLTAILIFVMNGPYIEKQIAQQKLNKL